MFQLLSMPKMESCFQPSFKYAGGHARGAKMILARDLEEIENAEYDASGSTMMAFYDSALSPIPHAFLVSPWLITLLLKLHISMISFNGRFEYQANFEWQNLANLIFLRKPSILYFYFKLSVIRLQNSHDLSRYDTGI